jgi:hypothetical protein
LKTVCAGWPHTVILLISVFQIIRIIGMSHQCLAELCILKGLLTCCISHLEVLGLHWDKRANKCRI